MFGQDIAIDLGTATVLVYIKGKGIVLQEPSVVAVNKHTQKVLAVGEEAERMLGRTPGSIVAIRPLRDGVISDYEMTEKMIKAFLKKSCGFMFFKPRVMVCVPSGITEVEERAVIDATIQAGAKKAYLIEEPVAAAIGAGIDISRPVGNMVVDIGGGTTDIAVISLNGIVESNSIKMAGNKFDETLIKHIKRRHNILIGDRTAEDLKKNIGCVYPREEQVSIEIKGRCLLSGLPKTVTVTSEEVLEALSEPAYTIVEAVHAVLERTPPELVGDISNNGIFLTGGGSKIFGMDKLISEKTGIDARVVDNAIESVVCGTGKALEELNSITEGTLNVQRNKMM